MWTDVSPRRVSLYHGEGSGVAVSASSGTILWNSLPSGIRDSFSITIPSVAFLKLTASSRLLAPPSGSPKCLRFGPGWHWALYRSIYYLLTKLFTYCSCAKNVLSTNVVLMIISCFTQLCFTSIFALHVVVLLAFGISIGIYSIYTISKCDINFKMLNGRQFPC